MSLVAAQRKVTDLVGTSGRLGVCGAYGGMGLAGAMRDCLHLRHLLSLATVERRREQTRFITASEKAKIKLGIRLPYQQ